MIRIAALNNDCSDDSDSESDVQESTKEAQEAEAFALYNNALSLQRTGKHTEAQNVYEKLLQTSLITQESLYTTSSGEGLVRPGAILKYSAMKNLASLASEKHDLHTAMKYYLKAVELDRSDVTVWYHMGKIALQLCQLSLARLAFEEALTCNPNHWPSMDTLCTVLYSLNDYYSCMYIISKALDRDGAYTKGLVLREKMYQEQPTLKRECEHLFHTHNFYNFDQKFSKEEAEKIVTEAVDIRNKRRELMKQQDVPIITPPTALNSLSWKCLGESLVSAYDLVDQEKPKLSFGHQVHLVYKSPPVEVDLSKSQGKPIEDPVIVAISVSPSTVMESTLTTAVTPTMPQVSTPISIAVTSTVQSASESQQSESVSVKSKEEETMDMDLGSSSATEKGKRGPKRKRTTVPSDENPSAKRRSQRVRNTVKKKEESVDYKDLLRKFLPSSLREAEEDDDDEGDGSTEDKDLSELIKERETVQHSSTGSQKSSDSITFISTESTDVNTFLTKYQNNNGVVDLMIQYCVGLAQSYSRKWPAGLTDIYIDIYGKLKHHLSLPSYLCKSVSDQRIKEVAMISLVNSELQLEKWLATKLKSPATSSTIPTSTSPESTALLSSNPGQVFQSDLQYLEGLCNFKEILGDSWLQFAIRVYWLKSRYLMLHGKVEKALDNFDVCDQLLTPQEGDKVPVEVSLPNCKDDIITLDKVKKQVESLQRCQSLEEVHRLYEICDYKKIVELLLPTLNQPTSKGKVMEVGKTIPERPAQLLLLLDALYQIKDYQLCVSCSVNTLNEGLQQLTSSTSMTVKENWVSTMTKVFRFIDKCLHADKETISKIPRSKLVNFTNIMTKVIELAMESTESTDLPIIGTVLPWIILYRLIKHEEDQLKMIQVNMSDKSEDSMQVSSEEIKLMPSSLMLLYTAHEYLGRRGWCCNSDGYLLTFYVDVLQQELEMRVEKDALRQDLCLALEQCFYCLYGHPNKKTKARHLQDHGVEEVMLTWEKAVFVFNYFKPKTVPEFDSYKTSSMSGELENLLLKISKVIPNEENQGFSLDAVQGYIESSTDKVPIIEPDASVTLPVVKELYYLLADYYFKNKEWGKAIKYYMHDICVCPERFDSWAGMALARSSRLEAKLSSCDVKNEGAMQKNAQAAIRCFQRALEIDETNCTLWIECGSLAYALHSHSSRQLKQQKNQVSLSAEMATMLTVKREEMLVLAKKCFTRAKDCEGDGEEEEWLIHYMLGKVAEKQHDSPKVYVEHYKEASIHLHEDHACYPKKIHYHNPPDLAMEALEVHFRLHASVLKLLEDGKCIDIDFDLIEQQIRESANGPFAKGQQKEPENFSTSSPSSQDIPKPTFTATPLDHDYTLIHKSSKRKNADASQGSSAQESDRHYESKASFCTSDGNMSESTQSTDSEMITSGSKNDDDKQSSSGVSNKDSAQSEKASTAKESSEENLSEATKTETKEPTVREKQVKLIGLCLDALALCLSRFPQHYKSLYRMANLYLISPTHKNLQWSRDLLLGTGMTPWNQCTHMPAQGLFAERNKSNFFNGIWRIPVDEIDRPGSFPSHMHRSITLLLEVLLHLKDYKVLFQISTQLQRTPDQGKKYLRDMDRILLAKQAYDYALTVMEDKVTKEKVKDSDTELHQLLQDTFRVWQYGSSKLQSQMDFANKVLSAVYKAYKHNQVEEGIPLLDQAIKHCSQYSTIHKQPQTPTHGDYSFWSPTTHKTVSFPLKDDADSMAHSKSEDQGSNVKESREPNKPEKSDSSHAPSVSKKRDIPRHSDDSNSLNEVESIVSNVDIPSTWSSAIPSDLTSLSLPLPYSQAPTGTTRTSPAPKHGISPSSEGVTKSMDQKFSFQKCFEKSLLQTNVSPPRLAPSKGLESKTVDPVSSMPTSKSSEILHVDKPSTSSSAIIGEQKSSALGQQFTSSSRDMPHSKADGFAGLSVSQLTGIAESKDFGTMVSQLVESLVGTKSEKESASQSAEEVDLEAGFSDDLFPEGQPDLSEDHGIDTDMDMQLAYEFSQLVGDAPSSGDILKGIGDSDEGQQ
ncbi:calcineurin-binding protein cabin-1-like [Ptychodera flava]|uniref:calcineurin-binding protein cabin-1-like n=1 Tax=Ptychodera flava TaxID=63121 RepID=UPI00396A1E91